MTFIGQRSNPKIHEVEYRIGKYNMGFWTAKIVFTLTFEGRSSNSYPKIFEDKQLKVLISNKFFSKIK